MTRPVPLRVAPRRDSRAVKANTPPPAIGEKPRAVATIRRVDDPERLDKLLAILKRALDRHRESGGR